MIGLDFFSIIKKFAFTRVAGSANELKAAWMIADEIKKEGGNFFFDEFFIKKYQTKESKFFSSRPSFNNYPATAYLASPDADLKDVPFVYIENEEGLAYNDIKDKIVLLNGKLKPHIYQKLITCKAKGFVTYGGELKGRSRRIDAKELRDMHLKHGAIPGVHIHAKDAYLLVKENPETVGMKIRQSEKVIKSQNVCALIKGKSEKEIVFTAHYDSVEESKGIYDNASGSVIMLALYKHYSALSPYHTLRFIWCGAEERGLLGSMAYVKKKKDELKNVVLNINIDVAGPLLGVDGMCAMIDDAGFAYLKARKEEIEYPGEISRHIYSSDGISFAMHNIPSLNFYRRGEKGTAYMHSKYDNLDFIGIDTLQKTYLYIASFISLFVDEDLPSLNVGKDMEDEIKRYLGN